MTHAACRMRAIERSSRSLSCSVCVSPPSPGLTTALPMQPGPPSRRRSRSEPARPVHPRGGRRIRSPVWCSDGRRGRGPGPDGFRESRSSCAQTAAASAVSDVNRATACSAGLSGRTHATWRPAEARRAGRRRTRPRPIRFGGKMAAPQGAGASGSGGARRFRASRTPRAWILGRSGPRALVRRSPCRTCRH